MLDALQIVPARGRLLSDDLTPRHAVHGRDRCWIAASALEAMVDDLRAVLRLSQGPVPDPSAAVLDARTLQSTPETGTRAGCDEAGRRRRCTRPSVRWAAS